MVRLAGVGGATDGAVPDGGVVEPPGDEGAAADTGDDGGAAIVPVEPVYVAPAPEPTPAPALTNDIERLVCSYPWDCYQALNIMWCESGGRADAYNGFSGVSGLFQIHPIHADRFAAHGWDFWTDAFVPERNVQIAWEIYEDRWWNAWACPWW